MHVYVLSEMGEKSLAVDCASVDLFVFATGLRPRRLRTLLNHCSPKKAANVSVFVS
jgi:hypothetical protein